MTSSTTNRTPHPALLVEHLRELGLREHMIATSEVRPVAGCWVVHFVDGVRCPPVVIGDDGAHFYFDSGVSDNVAVEQFRRHRHANQPHDLLPRYSAA